MRINETGPGSGSSWTSPDGEVVEWMFFNVPTAAALVSIKDQLGRGDPFYLDGDSPTTQYNATMVIDPPGNSTGATTATFNWIDPAGNTIWQKTGIPIYYVQGLGWATQHVIAANTTFTPFNATDAYWVQVTMGSFIGSADFFVLSTQWITVTIDVAPTDGQWFDPSSFKVTFTAQVNTGVTANPYQDVYNVTLQFWNATHYQGTPLTWDRMLANMSWNITGYPVVSGSSYTYTYTVMIPTSWIDIDTLTEFFGTYKIKSIPSIDPIIFPAVMAEGAFYVDDPIEGYISLEKASTTQYSVFEQKTAVIWANAEFDPTFLRSRQNSNAVYDDKDVNITWYWKVPPTLQKPVGNDPTTMTQDAAWPSDQYWAFSTATINSSWNTGTYNVIVNATCDTGYVVRELITYTVVYRVIYLEIWPKWEEYAPCMKKSIIGRTYYLDEYENEVPVEYGFFITGLIDPNGIWYMEPVDDHSVGEDYISERFDWTITKIRPDGTVAWGAVWDELPSDAEPGTWTVHAMVLGADWQDTDVQEVTIDEVGYSYQGPDTCTFVVAGEDVHLMIDDILDGIDSSSNVTWEMLDEVLAALADLETQITDLTDDEIAAIISGLDDVLAMLTTMDTDIMAKLDGIEDYVKEIRALSSRIDRWRTDFAADMADNFAQVIFELDGINNNINSRSADLGSQLQVSLHGINERDPRSISYKIGQVKTAAVEATVNSLTEMIDKMDTMNAGLGEKLANILNAISSEIGGLDESVRAQISANIEYAISSIRSKVDDSTAVLGTKIADAANGLHGKFSGVISEIGYVSDKVDSVYAKLGGVEDNVKDKVDSVDASIGTKLLVAIILIVIVLILCLLPIVAPGFRMKE